MLAWDVFISHASEDKPAVTIPLANVLQRAGLRVWLDRQELRLGDSLLAKIDEGLANSRFGVVILSPSFFAKEWPRRELDGLVALEDAHARSQILPVWHEINKQELAKHSPTLAGLLAANTADGIAAVAGQIVEVVTEPGSRAPSELAPTPLRLLVNLLDSKPQQHDVVGFLSSHPRLVRRAIPHEDETALWSTRLGPLVVDLCVKRTKHTTREVTWTLVQFQPPAEPPTTQYELSRPLRTRIDELRSLRRWIGENLTDAREVLTDVVPAFSGIVVAGRRQMLSDGDAQTLRRHHESVPNIEIRTYDWVVDAAADVD
jgi:hypothetical protein